MLKVLNDTLEEVRERNTDKCYKVEKNNRKYECVEIQPETRYNARIEKVVATASTQKELANKIGWYL